MYDIKLARTIPTHELDRICVEILKECLGSGVLQEVLRRESEHDVLRHSADTQDSFVCCPLHFVHCTIPFLLILKLLILDVTKAPLAQRKSRCYLPL